MGNMVPKIYLEEGLDGNDFRAMPARYGKYAGIKWAALFPQNVKKGNGPSVSANIIINSLENGRPLAMMDGMLITSYRTAAVTGLATKYLSRTDSSVASFIGCGFQTRFQVEAVLATRDIKHIKLFDLNEDHAATLCRYLGESDFTSGVMGCEICETVEDCVRGSDILTTLTPSRKPFIMASWLEPGIHVNAIGADAQGKQEFENDIVNLCGRFVVDDKTQAFHSGESQHSKNKGPMVDLFHVVKSKRDRGVNGATAARLDAENKGISFFDSTGLAIEDVALAGVIYEHYTRSEITKQWNTEK
jgi:alanine dehydrogenase